jgi:hypothetical protein
VQLIRSSCFGKLYFAKAAIILAAFAFFPQSVQAQGTLRGFVLNQCNRSNTKCLTARAKVAEGSQLKRLFALTDVKVKVLHKETQKIYVRTSKTGYVDFENNLLVLTPRHRNREYAYRLDTITLKMWKIN